MKKIFFAFVCFAAGSAFAWHQFPERWYQQRWCYEHGGAAEVLLADDTRCDCITNTHAIEFDFSHKWAEALGQALYYGMVTGKIPGIVLIDDASNSSQHNDRLRSIIAWYNLPITTWIINN